MPPSSIATSFTWDTEYSADTVEWCPVEPLTDLLAVGTYQVKESDEEQFSGDQRTGRLTLHHYNNDGTLTLLQSLDTAAILDMKWSPHMLCNSAVLSVADAVGKVTLFTVVETSTEEDKTFELRKLESIEVVEDGLALSLDWNTRKHSNGSPHIAVSDSKGRISILKVTNFTLDIVSAWKGHDFEAWITAFDCHDENVVFSGGDDCKLRVYDIRTQSPTALSKAHSMGVTSLQSDVFKEQRLFSGSYDELLHYWDTRNMKSSEKEVHLGGGIWRIKQNPRSSERLLTACMHNGFQLLNEFKLFQHYREHKSLAYGADWKCDGSIVATCSFYDHMLKIWKII